MGLMPLARKGGVTYIQPKRRFGLQFMPVGLWFADHQTMARSAGS